MALRPSAINEMNRQGDMNNTKTEILAPPNRGLLAWALFLVAVSVAINPLPGLAVGSWATITNFPYSNPGHMLLLSDGAVMIQNSANSGWYSLKPDNHGHYLNGNWSTNNPMHVSREFYSSDVLTDGRVFVAGGEYTTPTNGGQTAEIFNPLDNGGAG